MTPPRFRPPSKFTVSPRNVTRFINGDSSENVFLAGSLAFPVPAELSAPYGILCVLGFFEADGKAALLDLVRFQEYDNLLAAEFLRQYQNFGISDYFCNQHITGNITAQSFMIRMEQRIYFHKDTMYPRIRNISMPDDFHAFDPMLSIMKQNNLILNDNPMIQNAVGSFDPNSAFSKAPVEIQAVAVAAAGGFEYAWKAFELERLHKISQSGKEDDP